MWFCKSFFTQLTFMDDKIVPCCGNVSPAPFKIPYLQTPQETIENYLDYRKEMMDNMNPPENCIGCPDLVIGGSPQSCKKEIDYINLSFYPSFCQSKCIYCYYAEHKEMNNYEAASKTFYAQYISEIIPYLKKKDDILDKNVWIQISPGEVTVHPHKELIYDTVKNYNNLFFTNGFIFDPKIAEILSKTQSLVQCDIDAGTKETFQKIKGVDQFDQVVGNLEKYIAYSHRIRLKYMILPNINDSDKDFKGIIKMMNHLNRHTLWIAKNLYDLDADAYARSIALLLHVLHKNKLQHHFVYPFTQQDMALIHAYYFKQLPDERISNYLREPF